MVDPDLRTSVQNALALDRAAFEERAREEAATVLEAIDDGTFDNPQGLVGLEYEFYAVSDREDADRWIGAEQAGTPGSLARVPRPLLSYVGFESELGLHNAELSTNPHPLNHDGLQAQEHEVAAQLRAVRNPLRANGLRLVSDGVWTVPPTGESAAEYLTDAVTVEDLLFAANMSDSGRYHAMSNASLEQDLTVSLPGVHFEADTVMPVSLTTSIQPHYQVPVARDLPEYLRYALRVAGPLLAVGANSPFVPPDLYDDGVDPETVLGGHDESRIAIFEGVLNGETEKVRFPRDMDTVDAVMDDLVDDPTLVPADLRKNGSRFDDQFAHLRHKHGTYWRWVRPVFGGASERTANARIEFRPLPAQPTVGDAVAFQATFAGLMVGLYAEDHPVRALEWERARENFYAAAERGFDADLTWITADGERTTDLDRLYDDVLSAAAAGLEMQGVASEAVGRYLEPLERRIVARTNPSDWKRERARRYLDAGDSVEAAIHATQRDYFDRQAETFYDGRFADWLD